MEEHDQVNRKTRVANIAARWLRDKATSKGNQEVLCSITQTIVNGAEM
jgi:hypothetical protein